MNFNEVIKDPDFLGLPQAEQLKVLSQIDTDFAGLPGPEQVKVLGVIGKPAPVATAQPQPAPTAPGTPAEPLDLMGIPSGIDMTPIQQHASVPGAMAGMTAGSFLGLPGALAGGAIGGLGGGLLERMNEKETPGPRLDLSNEPPDLMGIPGSVEGIGKPAFDAAMGAAGAIPFGKAMGPVGEVAGGVLKEAGEMYGLPQMAYKARPWLKWITETTPAGKWMVERYEGQFNKAMLKERDAIVDTYLNGKTMPTEEGLGYDVGETLKGIAERPEKAYERFRAGSVAVDDFGNTFTGGAVQFSNETAALAHKYLPGAEGSTKKWLEHIIAKRSGTTDEIADMLGGKSRGVSGIDPTIKEEFKQSIIKDLQTHDVANETALSNLYIDALTAYSEAFNKWAQNPAFAAALRKFDQTTKFTGIRPKPNASFQPEGVVDSIMVKSRPEQASEILAQMPSDLADMTRARWLQGEIEKHALSPDGTRLIPSNWVNRFDQIEGRIKDLAPDAYPRVKQFTDMLGKSAETIGKESSQVHPRMGIGDFGRWGFGVGGASIYAATNDPRYLMGFGAMNGLSLVLAMKFLGPKGTSLIRKIASNELSGTAASMGGLLGAEALE